MSAINANTVDAWRLIASDLSAQRPYPGREVRVESGKHRGALGRVIRHMPDRYDRDAFRYGSDGNLQMREMAGRRGFAVQVDTGSALIWVKAHYVRCVDPASMGSTCPLDLDSDKRGQS